VLGDDGVEQGRGRAELAAVAVLVRPPVAHRRLERPPVQQEEREFPRPHHRADEPADAHQHLPGVLPLDGARGDVHRVDRADLARHPRLEAVLQPGELRVALADGTRLLARLAQLLAQPVALPPLPVADLAEHDRGDEPQQRLRRRPEEPGVEVLVEALLGRLPASSAAVASAAAISPSPVP
jgi:hypothetical protein